MEKLKENQLIPVGEKVKVGFKIFKVVESTDSLSCINRPDGKEVYFVECNE